MIDLHSHLLHGVDDGAPNLKVSLEMARLWCADGVTTVACTPHILPGVYPNTGQQILAAIEGLRMSLALCDIPLHIVSGADNHMVPDFVAGLKCGHLLPLAGSRYVLVEPPHTICPPRIEQFFFDIQAAGYVPILTHPERLTWIDGSYSVFQGLARRGVWMQITAGSLTEVFGRRPRYWAERMLDEGLVHILATDAHGADMRPPRLSEGYDAAVRRVGEIEAKHLVVTRPQGIVDNLPVSELPQPPGLIGGLESKNGHAGHESAPGSRGWREAGASSSGADRGGLSGRLRRIFKR